MGHVVLENKAIGHLVPEQEGYGPIVLGHKVYMLAALGHRDFVPGALGQKDSEPIGHRKEDSPLATAGLDLELVPARVALVDRYIRVATTQVGFFDLAVAKFVPSPTRVWV